MESILDMLEDKSSRFPDRTAFKDPIKSISFSELEAIAKKTAMLLIDEGVKPGEPVAFYMEKSVDAVCAMMGVLYAGGFYSFIDVR